MAMQQANDGLGSRISATPSRSTSQTAGIRPGQHSSSSFASNTNAWYQQQKAGLRPRTALRFCSWNAADYGITTRSRKARQRVTEGPARAHSMR